MGNESPLLQIGALPVLTCQVDQAGNRTSNQDGARLIRHGVTFATASFQPHHYPGIRLCAEHVDTYTNQKQLTGIKTAIRIPPKTEEAEFQPSPLSTHFLAST